VDDDLDDARLALRTLTRLNVKNPIHALRNGEELIAYLRGEEQYQDRAAFPYPAMILLDLKMPGVDGFDILKWLLAHPSHQSVPVIVLSGACELNEVNRAYQLGARTFFTKPIRAIDFENAARAFCIPIQF